MENSRSLRERVKGVNYSVVGLHVKTTPGWLKGNRSTTREKPQKPDHEKENEAPANLKRALRRHSAPTHQLENPSKEPGAGANAGPKKSARSDDLTLEGKAAPATGNSLSAPSPEGPTKKRRAAQASSGGDTKPAKRRRPSQTKKDNAKSPEQELKRSLRPSTGTRANSQLAVEDQEGKPQAPVPRKGRNAPEGSAGSADGCLERSKGSDGGRASALVAAAAPEDQTGNLQPKASNDAQKDGDTRRRKAKAAARDSIDNSPEDGLSKEKEIPQEEPPLNNFVELQAEYFKLLKKYQELKESKLAELESVFSDQAKRVAEHGEAAMKLAEHWEREARRQAAFAAAAGSAELEAELQELRARVITLNKDLIALESTVLERDESIVDLTAQLHEALKRAEPSLTAEQGVQCSPERMTRVSIAQQCPSPSAAEHHADPICAARMHLAVACCPEGAYMSELGSLGAEPTAIPDTTCQTPLATTVQGPAQGLRSGRVDCRSSAKPLVPYPVGCSVFPRLPTDQSIFRSALQVPLPTPIPCATLDTASAAPTCAAIAQGDDEELPRSVREPVARLAVTPGLQLVRTPCSIMPTMQALASLAGTGQLDTLQRTRPGTLVSSTETPMGPGGAGPPFEPHNLSALSMLTGLEVVGKVGRTFTLKHSPTGFTFNIGPTGNPFTPLEGESDQFEELIFQPLDLGKAAEVLPPYVRYEIRFSSAQRQRLLGRIMEALGKYAKLKKADTVEGLLDKEGMPDLNSAPALQQPLEMQ